MTTVAYKYKDKEIAVDGRITRGGRIDEDSGTKWYKEGGDTFIFSGAVCDFGLLVDFFYAREPEGSSTPECVCFVITEGVVYNFMVPAEGHPVLELLTTDYTCGSGGDFALAAMDFGRTAREAVKYAMTRDVYTGGKIKVFKVK